MPDGSVATTEPPIVPSAPGRWNARRVLVAVAAACVVLIGAIYLIAVRTHFGQRIDEAPVLHHRYDRTFHAHFLDDMLFAGSVVLVPAIIALTLRRLELFAAGAIAIIGAVACAETLRTSVLGRPYLGVFNALYGPSFPSGHAAAAMVCALMLVVASPAAGMPRWLAVAVGQCVAASVGVLAVFIPIHLPSDVIGGYFVAVAAVCLALAAVPNASSGFRWSRAELARSCTTALLVTPVLLLVLLAGATLAAHRVGLGLGDLGRSFPVEVVASTVVAGAILVVFSAMIANGPE